MTGPNLSTISRQTLSERIAQLVESIGIVVAPLSPIGRERELIVDHRWLVHAVPLLPNGRVVVPERQVALGLKSFTQLWAWERDDVIYVADEIELAPIKVLEIDNDGVVRYFYDVSTIETRTLLDVVSERIPTISVPRELSPEGPMQITLEGGEEPMGAAVRELGDATGLIVSWMRDGFCPFAWQIGTINHVFRSASCGVYVRDRERGPYTGQACCRQAVDGDGPELARQMRKRGISWKAEDGRNRLIGRDAREGDGERWDAIVEDLARLARVRAAELRERVDEQKVTYEQLEGGV